MEDVLEVYKRPYNANRPLICMDEMPKQLLADTREPIACQPGVPARQDYEYKRNGVEDLFMLFEPLQGKRYVEVKDQRRRIEWACVMKLVSDELYPDAEKIVVVLDNLNTHTPASFYETFEPEEARRLAERFEFHFTPKHGSWLNMAEIELSVLWYVSVWIAVFQTKKCSSRKCQLGNGNGTTRLLKYCGSLQLPMHVSS